MREEIKVGDQVFVADSAEVCGAVRQVEPHGRPEIVIYVENAGDFVVPLAAVQAAHARRSLWTVISWGIAYAGRSDTLTMLRNLAKRDAGQQRSGTIYAIENVTSRGLWRIFSRTKNL